MKKVILTIEYNVTEKLANSDNLKTLQEQIKSGQFQKSIKNDNPDDIFDVKAKVEIK